ncbi:hypothetical protein C9F11_17815 [Streptomyces sp. YIM 121038]|nr:hypothetical protein [Streptomyces sp. YIM 121038]QCX77215.1 hypothetical protein C9F11_17815 [Streptomyces sp. YIM 121038]
MTAVAVEITARPKAPQEPEGLTFVDDVESLTEDSSAACNDDNPYR